MASRQLYARILDIFPKNYMQFAFAYGSGAFQQQGHVDKSKNMLDFVIAVDNPEQWHRENMEKNSEHYSILKYFGPKYIATFQDTYGARVYYNTLVKFEDRLIKYGLVSTDALIADLLDWETLYISGRLHKPVATLHEGNHPELKSSLNTNLRSAVSCTLLLVDETFTEEELFCKIAGLSYTGDFRMTIGEDQNKIINIVKPNIEEFKKLYEPVLDLEQYLHWDKSSGTFEQSLSAVSTCHHLNLLPKMLQFALVSHRNMDGRSRDTEEVLRSLSHDPECDVIVQECLGRIVKRSSVRQSIKGIFTAGLVKTTVYSFNKVKKMWKSMKLKKR